MDRLLRLEVECGICSESPRALYSGTLAASSCVLVACKHDCLTSQHTFGTSPICEGGCTRRDRRCLPKCAGSALAPNSRAVRRICAPKHGSFALLRTVPMRTLGLLGRTLSASLGQLLP